MPAEEVAEHTALEVGRRLAPSFALIIGIDDYVNYQKLSGAVADARLIQQHFEEDLQVPRDQIVTLYDDKATRLAIIEVFQKLKRDERIKKGDPIVIFYAGHGGEINAPSIWRYKGKIQCLVPHDCTNHRGAEEVSEDYAPIPDRTIGVLIADIAKVKGDNITVIFDCCHSASGTRDGYVPRSANLEKIVIPEYLDGHIWRGRIGKVSQGFAYQGLRSHVLLAACREGEKAYEHERRGQFTTQLLETLRSCAVDNSDLTYTEVLERMYLKWQHPQCEGVNRHRVLYDTRVPAGRQLWYPVRFDDGKCIVEAGLSHGVKPGVELSLYNDKKLWLRVVQIDEAASIGDFETTITTSVDAENVSFAKLTRVGKVPLYLGNDSVLEETLRRLDGDGSNAANFRVVREVEEAKLQVAMENNQAVFTLLDQCAQSLGLTTLPHKGDLDNLAYVLGAAAHYFWYFGLENEKCGLGAKIAVDFFYLNCDYDDFGTKFFFTVGEGFYRKDPNSGNSGMIDFVVDPKGRYGIEIKNNTRKDLYLNAFLFNASSLSIAACYTQNSAGKPEAPLKPDGIFTIGYGSGGAPPFSFSFEKGQDIDVSYLKIFFSTQPIDLCDVEQPSPFTKNHPPPQGDRRAATQIKSPPGHDIWFTFLIPVVQRKMDVVAS